MLTKDLGLLFVALYTQPQYGSFCEFGLSILTCWYSSGCIPKYKSEPALYPSHTSIIQSGSIETSVPTGLYVSSHIVT
nr:MAG TPA: hypothetical protein [Caudoviricetes sp.]